MEPPGFGVSISVFLLLPLLALAGCSNAAAPPETRPTAPLATGPYDDLDELIAEAEGYFTFGEEAYARGEYATADDRFQRALDVYVAANVDPADSERLQAAFNDLFNRKYALSVSGLIGDTGELVDLDEEELPSPSTEDLAALHARLTASPPELPRFAIDVPSPLENERVEWALAYLTGDRKEVIEEGLSQATRYMPMIDATFDEVGVPRELAWMALIESLFKTGAYSRAAAVGMWQFVSGTARLYGMRVGQNVDERKDPVRSTRMAAIYLRDLYEEFGDWPLVLAAYNAGKGRIGRAMEQTGADDFWSLSAARRAIPRETTDHVPKVYAAILIGTDPEYYGLQVEQRPPYVYEESVMDANTDLRLVADLVGISFDEIRELNPHIAAWVPEGYAVRIPPGSKATFEAAIAEVPAEDLLQFMTHVVARGDTLSGIAGQYPGTRMSAIVEVNNIRNPNRLSIGDRLIIPVGPEARPYRPQPVAGFETGERTTYTVQRGDSLYEIAQNFRTTVPNVMRWNDLRADRIYPGDSLIVYYGIRGNMATPAAVTPASTPATPLPAPTSALGAPTADGDDEAPASTAASARGVHTVRRGESLYLIAARYGASVEQIKDWNNRGSDTIHPGDMLVVYAPEFASSTVGGAGAVTSVQRYTVRRGDSPYEIAQRYGVDLDALLAANGLSRRSNIYPGEELLIPGGGASSAAAAYTVRRGDTLSAIADSHGVPLRSLLQANGLSSRSVIHPGDRIVIPRR